MSDLAIETVAVGIQLELRCADGTSFTFETPFALVDASGTSHAVVPAELARRPDAAVTALAHRAVIEWTVDSDTGTLRLRISDGATITAPPDPDYEAWNLRTASGELVVALPGSGTAEYLP